MKYNPSLKQFTLEIQACLDALNESGDITTSELQETGEIFTIFEGWKPVYKLNTLAAIYAHKYHFYNEACQHAHDDKTMSFEGFIQVYDKQYILIQDFRLGRDKHFPYDDKPSYLIPESFQPYVDVLESLMGNWGFSDEYCTCSNCYKIIRTSPDSYNWQAEFYLGDGEILCPDCIDTESMLEEYKNTNKAVPDFILRRADCNLVELDREFSNGFFSGQDDSPEKLIKAFKDSDIDIWFKINPSQFYVDFQVLVMSDNEAAASELLNQADSYQGFSTSGELSKALQNKPAEITVTTTKLTESGYVTSTNNDKVIK